MNAIQKKFLELVYEELRKRESGLKFYNFYKRFIYSIERKTFNSIYVKLMEMEK